MQLKPRVSLLVSGALLVVCGWRVFMTLTPKIVVTITAQIQVERVVVVL
jgi:hypothetical protein